MPTFEVPRRSSEENDHTPTLHSCKAPLVLESVCAGWDACKLWLSPDYFLQSDGQGVNIDVSVSSNTQFSGDQERRQTVQMQFGTFVDVMCSLEKGESHPATELGLTYYLCQAPIYVPANIHRDPCAPTHAILPHLSRDITVPACVPKGRLVTANVWMATAGDQPIHSNLHYDVHQNLLCVVRGRKRVRLLPPSMTPLLEARPVYTGSANHSTRPGSWLDNPPENCWVMEAVVKAGDGLLIPEGWWHQVDSDPSTIAVNFWLHSDLPVTLMAVPHKISLPNQTSDNTAHILGEEDETTSSKEIPCVGNLEERKRKLVDLNARDRADITIKKTKIGSEVTNDVGNEGGMNAHRAGSESANPGHIQSEGNHLRVGDVGTDVYYARVLIGGLVEKYVTSNVCGTEGNQSDATRQTKYDNLSDLQPIIDELHDLGVQLIAGISQPIALEASFNILRLLDNRSYAHVLACLARGSKDVWKVLVDSMPNVAAAGLLSRFESTQTLHAHISSDGRPVSESSSSRPDSELAHYINAPELIEKCFVEPFGEEEAERMLNTIAEKRKMFSKEMMKLVFKDVLGVCDDE